LLLLLSFVEEVLKCCSCCIVIAVVAGSCSSLKEPVEKQKVWQKLIWLCEIQKI